MTTATIGLFVGLLLAIAAAAGGFTGFLIAISVFGVFATTLFVAAWAESYRQLKGDPV